MAVRPTFNVLSLCAGAGGLELGLKLAVPTATVVCYAEREAYNAAVLVGRMEGGQLDDAPIWSDLGTFNGRPWRGVVDCVAAGFPCQPFSLAGKREGQADDRWIWPDIARIIRDVRPGYVFLENVPGILPSGLGDVLGDLAALGFDAEWGVFSAAGSGAPHIRKRVFVLADASSKRLSQRQVEHHGQCPPVAGGCGSDWPVEPDVGRVADGVAFRVDRLRAIGNGVVPAVAARAWRVLSERLDT